MFKSFRAATRPSSNPHNISRLEILESRTLLSAVGPDVAPHYPFVAKGPVKVAMPIAAASQNPTAVINVSQNSGPVGTTITFSANGSSDPKNQALSFVWNFGDGTATQRGFSVQHIYTTQGLFTAKLTATDTSGLSGTSQTPLAIGVTPPQPIIASPTSTTFHAGSIIRFFGTASDAQDGTIPNSFFTWRFILHNGATSTRLTRPITGVSIGSFRLPKNLPANPDENIRVILTVRNSFGLTQSTQVILRPQVADLSLQSGFPNVKLFLDGQAVIPPQTVSTVVGTFRTISAPQFQHMGAFDLVFRKWSDGGAQTHRVRVGVGGKTVYALYRIVPVAHRQPLARPAAAMASMFGTNPIAGEL